jgi:hypothetical protein
MPYTEDAHQVVPSADELRARIPGWGVDLDPHDRPSVPQERPDPNRSDAHWHFPERQPERWPRERSIEHLQLTPVFGTSCPPKGLSGVMRRYAYRTYSEARAAHWLLLLAADRIDAAESHLRSFATLRPDNPFTQTGVRAELTHHGLASRRGQRRADWHHVLDPIIVVGPWIGAASLARRVIRGVVRRGRRARPPGDRRGPEAGAVPTGAPVTSSGRCAKQRAWPTRSSTRPLPIGWPPGPRWPPACGRSAWTTWWARTTCSAPASRSGG